MHNFKSYSSIGFTEILFFFRLFKIYFPAIFFGEKKLKFLFCNVQNIF
jgi:hypothetical protein